MTNHHWIVEHFEGKGHFDTELLLTIIAMELHSGRTSSFYEMLAFMKNSKNDLHQRLAAQIQLQFEIPDQLESSGMYTSIYIDYTVTHIYLVKCRTINSSRP